MNHLTAILPCTDLERSAGFYARLGFQVTSRHEGYWLLTDGKGASLHLNRMDPEWFVPERNPCSVYLYTEEVERLADAFAGQLLGAVEDKPWGMFEFAVSDPDQCLVRVGRRSAP